MLLAPLRPRRRRPAMDSDARADRPTAPRSTDLSVVAVRIAGLIDGPVSEALVMLLTDLYGDALTRILAVVEAAPGGPAILQTIADDTLVGGLLVVHDLHPQPLARRVERALDAVASTLGATAAFTLDRIEDDVVYVRAATADGTGRAAVTRAIAIAAPEIASVCTVPSVWEDLRNDASR